MVTYECPICFESNGVFRSLPCWHSFHENCLLKYLKSNKKIFPCPVCRDTQILKNPSSFIKRLPTCNVECLSCKMHIPVECINHKHGGCNLVLSEKTQNKLIWKIKKDMKNQEEEFKRYHLWADEQKTADLNSAKKYASDLISEVLEWKNNYCHAIEMYFEKDLKDLEKSNAYFKRCMEEKKLSISKSTTDAPIRNVLPTRVDLRDRKEQSYKIIPDFERNILTSVLPSTIDLLQAIENFRDPSEISEFLKKPEEKTSIDVQPSVCSEMESASEKETASAVDTGSDYECISDFEINAGTVYRANILPNDVILACLEVPNKLQMYDLNGSLLSETKLNDIPVDVTVWKDNQLIICYQNSSFELVTFENNNFIAQEVLKTPQSYDSISPLKPGLMLGRYKNKYDILKEENSMFKTIKSCSLYLSNPRKIYGNDQYIFYSGCSDDGLMPTQLNCLDRKTKEELCMFPNSTSNLSSENITDFTVNARVLFILDFRCHKVYSVDRSTYTSSVLLSEVDGIQKPFCVDINDSEHLLVCYNSMRQAKIKVFNIKQAAVRGQVFPNDRITDRMAEKMADKMVDRTTDKMADEMRAEMADEMVDEMRDEMADRMVDEIAGGIAEL